MNTQNNNPLVQLPHGDLWRAPEHNENNEVVERKNTVEAPSVRLAPVGMTPDQMAAIMHENALLAAQVNANPAGTR